jgi:hypothetical protein
MKIRSSSQCLLAAGFTLFLISARAATNTLSHVYPCGAEVAVKIGQDLVTSLDQRFKKTLDPDVVFLDHSGAPVIGLRTDVPSGALHQISVSTGFIDLLNHIAHAKAIDRVQPGYFHQYVNDLSQQTLNNLPVPPRNLDDPRYWTDTVMQDQASLFNQMMSITLALHLSHLYLEHYDKYARTAEGRSYPINNSIAPREWQASLRHAAFNSLDCALATEGAGDLFDCIADMPRRPSWADYILPQTVDIKKTDKLLVRCEYEYYYGSPTFNHVRRSWTFVGPKDDPNKPETVRRIELGPN